MIDALVALGVFVAAFLLGSIPWGFIISKVFYHTDIREHGSGNIGTTNAMRTMGKKGGAAVFLLDFGKGIASGFIGMGATSFLTGSFVSYETLLGIATMGCTLGHIFSPSLWPLAHCSCAGGLRRHASSCSAFLPCSSRLRAMFRWVPSHPRRCARLSHAFCSGTIGALLRAISSRA